MLGSQTSMVKRLKEMGRRRQTIESVLSKVTMKDGCWSSSGSHTKDGYANIGWQGRTQPLARVLYEHFIGPIPVGLELDHKCNKGHLGCCNPYHCKPETKYDNMIRGNGFSARNKRKTHCNKGHLLTGSNLKYELNGARRCKECACARSREYRARRRAVSNG